MSFGKMNIKIEIYKEESIKDAEGFTTKEEQVLTSIRASKRYNKNRHGREAWKNDASFSENTSLFYFRKPRGVELSTELFLRFNGEKYNILSVEDIEDRGQYMEVLAEKIIGSRG